MKKVIISEEQYRKIKLLERKGIFDNNRDSHVDKDGYIWCKTPAFPDHYMICGNINESRSKSYGGLDWLKKNEISLSDEEKAYFKKHGLTWDNGDLIIHKGKSKDDDSEVYFAWTHRAWGVKPTKSEAIKMGKFIKSTS